MHVRIISSISLIFIFLLAACTNTAPENPNYQADANDPELLHTAMYELSTIIVHDIFSPPTASRVYAYPAIAAYEAMQAGYPEFISMAGQLKELPPVPQPDTAKTYCFPLAGIQALLTVGKALVFSEDSMDIVSARLMKKFEEKGIPEEVFKRSVEYGNTVAGHILTWMDGDFYKETRTYPKHPVTEDPEEWKPTPPAYMDAIEPHWTLIRPFVIDSSTQFIPPPPTAFNMEEGSTFYDEVMEVYNVGNRLTEEQQEIAAFWDCNPFVMNVTGHVMYATKKITPGGHWIGITAIACRKSGANMIESAEAYARTSISLFDAFISCWDEKYRSNLIRPETVINQYLDPDWVPMLQTPPFPEYTSGHSVISTAAATTLTDLFGEPFAFTDTTEQEWGLAPRKFDSFLDASSEAAISRLYGGIHYMPAIENGVAQGRLIGQFVVTNLKTRSKDLQATAAK